MVNTEKLGNDTSRFQTAVAQSVGPLLKHLGQKLSSDASLEILQKLGSLPPLDDTNDQVALLELVDTSTASTLASDVATAAGISVLAESLAETEMALAQILSARASNHMNTIERLPHIATEAAQSIVAAKAGSLFFGSFADVFQGALSIIATKHTEKSARLSKLEKISLADFQSFRDEKVETATATALHCIASSIENLRSVVATSIFPLSEAYERTRDSTAALHSVGAFERKRIRVVQLFALIEDLKNCRNISVARGFLARGKSIAALNELNTALVLTENTVRLLRELEPSPALDPRNSRFLEAENYAYVQCLARHLLIAGETPRDVEKIAASLFEYAQNNAAAASELIDEEILKLNTNIKRESLTRSRLEVRLNDKTYPLSVSHKDWIMQATKLFEK